MSNILFKIFLTLILLFVNLPINGQEKILNEDNTQSQTHDISREVLGDIVKSIPAPLEISCLIKNLVVRYDRNLLTSLKNSKKYNSNNRQALNLGIYSADLGYDNVYEQT